MLDNRIRYYRGYQDLSQREVAEAVGVSRSFYSSWEYGTRIIPLTYLNRLSNFYNVSMDYLMGLSDVEKQKDFKSINELDKKEIGRRFKEIRQDNNLSLREIAKELNTGFSNIDKYELGKYLILTAFAFQVCKKYKVSLDWLCGKTKVKGLTCKK